MDGADRLRPAELERLLPTRRRLGRSCAVLERADSTNAEARRELEARPQAARNLDGRLIAAEVQRAGRGRRASDWWSGPAGANLAVTLIVCPTTDPPEALGLLAACALAGAVAPWTPVPPALKWPNDLRLGERKVAGLLVEMPSAAAAARAALVGLGLNVHAAPPPEVAPYATGCLADLASRRPVRTRILAAWLLGLEKRLARFERAGPGPLEAEFLGLLRRWAPHGVSGGPSEPEGPLLEFSVSQGLAWGTKQQRTQRPLGLVPPLEALSEPKPEPRP